MQRVPFLRTKLHNEDASIAPMFAVSLMAIIALVGAAIALSMDSSAAGNLQSSADTAALAGATAFVNAASPKADERAEQAISEARAVALANVEYALTEFGVSPIVEDAYGQHITFDVAMNFEPANPMAKVVGRDANIAIERKAIAEATWGFPLCMLSLNSTGTSLSLGGQANLTANNCIVWSNSSSSASMSFSGGRAKAKYFCAAGGISGRQYASPPPSTQCEIIPNPLENWRAPAPGSCASESRGALDHADIIEWYEEHGIHLGVDTNIKKGGGGGQAGFRQTTIEISGMDVETGEAVRHVTPEGLIDSGPAEGLTLHELLQLVGALDNAAPGSYADDRYYDQPTDYLTPGTYCGLDIAEGHVRFKPGIYFIKDAPLSVRRRATLSGEGVTIILTGPNATFSIIDEGRLDIKATTEGPTAGFAIAEDVTRTPRADQDDYLQSRMTGNGRISAIGTIYLPKQRLRISGSGAGEQASPLLQIVADTIEMSDQGRLKIEFDTTKTDVPATIKPERTARLVK